ncbi:hypothetical protein CANARDRAFT_27562 [[Candida] arabinofermentans NRRL YB-2248]|uniref:3-hydroxy-3-methylglutaryl coenzyme A reductase n=1 Tax=[Candida] arabinofermentans NRRL YB-2248 TaxID=983967 RepID=A0A1E4T3I7_9ASCO|nr:hypothetical protein CANARDRAFT_27562 [[Candida] arabinofermentans NRRL YB-2248]
MANILAEVSAYLAKICANRPIHVIIFTALAASITYLSIFDYYLSTTSQFLDTQPLSFYHPSGNSDYSKWVQVKDSSDYASSDHLALVPIKFKKADASELPKNENFITGIDETEKLLLTSFNSAPETLESLTYLTNEEGVQFKIRKSHRIGRYYEYLKTLVVKFESLIKGAEPFDIILVTFAYIAMWFTFGQLFYEMKKLGSNFWLAFGSLLASAFAFLFALAFSTVVLKLNIPLISLTEGLPFLVATIGFKHKVAFTAPVLKALNSGNKKDISIVISDVVRSQAAIPLIKEQMVIVASFLLCSMLASNLSGLINFCILSAVILTVDIFFTFTFYASILSLKAQINKVHQEVTLVQALEEDGFSETAAESIASSSESPASVFHYNSSILSFKVAMIAGFMGLHLFALGTSWLYDDSASVDSVIDTTSVGQSLSKSVAANIPIGKMGTLVTIMPTKVYSKINLFTKVEDLTAAVLEKLSKAITDPLVSKFLFVLAGISVAINIYLLNATKTHLASTSSPSRVASVQKRKHSKSIDLGSRKSITSQDTEVVNSLSSKQASSTIISKPSQNSSNDNFKEAQIVEEASSDDQSSSSELDSQIESIEIRPLDELVDIMKAGKVKECGDEEVVELAATGKLPLYALEKQLGDKTRAVLIRRRAISRLADAPILNSSSLPWKHYDYDRVFGACCENVIGYMPLPVGVAGPLIIDGVPYHIPMATTEGCLVASTMRGCKAINAGGGVQTVLTNDGMTRGPCVTFPTLARTGAAKLWLDSEEGQKTIKSAFNSTSRFARLQHVQTAMAGTLLFIRFKTTTGDAMGMNMISKGVEFSLKYMVNECGFEDMEIISVSGNYCTDKKPAAINWIEGRGKSVVAEARIPKEMVQKVLKSDVDAVVQLNISKNLIGSAMAGSVGGFNAQAANLVTAVYLATGQDPAQNVESSNCITLMNKLPNGDLQISVSMPCIEVGTIGGGTVLEPQGAMLELLGVRGPHPTEPGANARQLAKIVASTVLAAELSLCCALAAGHLVQSHMNLNRKAAPVEEATSSSATPAVAAAPALTSATTESSPAEGLSASDVKRLEEGSKICIRS